MVDWLHLSLGAIGVVVSLSLSFYCFRLINKFFKGGIFEASFKAFMVTGIMVVIALVFDVIAEAFGLESSDLHIFHLIVEILALGIFLYGIHKLYKAWTKLGPR